MAKAQDWWEGAAKLVPHSSVLDAGRDGTRRAGYINQGTYDSVLLLLYKEALRDAWGAVIMHAKIIRLVGRPAPVETSTAFR